MIHDWNKLQTIGQLLKEAVKVFNTGDVAEGQRFLTEYSLITEYARENIGYIAGYLDRETAQKMLEFFGVEHPVFGKKFPSLEEAFKKGLELGEVVRKERKCLK